MKQFRRYVRNRTVALVGNAASIFDHTLGPQIDQCDVVIRMNAGFVVQPEAQGSKTDIWVSSLPTPAAEVLEKMAPRLVIWATPKREHLPQEYHRQGFQFYLHPRWAWWLLRLRLDARPSTGAIAANYLSAYCKPRRVRIFGFDHFRSKTFYETRTDIGPHSKDGERRFFDRLYASGRFEKHPPHA